MRFILCFIIGLLIQAQAWALPARTGNVVDEAGIMSDAAKQTVTDLFRDNGVNNVIVVTVKSLNGKKMKDYIADLAQGWNLGQEVYDDGVILAVSSGDRVVRIGTGKSLLGKLPNTQSHRLIQEKMGPYIMSNNYSEAIIAGVKEIINALQAKEPVDDGKPTSKSWLFWILGVVVLGGILGYALKPEGKPKAE